MRHKKTIGYTTGVFDLFHVGHVKILSRAKSKCDELIVGVSTDELVRYKNKKPVIPFKERAEILRSIKYVDKVVAQKNMNKMAAWKKFKFDIMFVGDDWKDSETWKKYEKEFNQIGVRIKYFPYTKNTSSTLINNTLKYLRKKK